MHFANGVLVGVEAFGLLYRIIVVYVFHFIIMIDIEYEKNDSE